MKTFCKKIVNAFWSERFIFIVIIVNGAILGMETSPALSARFDGWLQTVREALVKLQIQLQRTAESGLREHPASPGINGWLAGWNVCKPWY